MESLKEKEFQDHIQLLKSENFGYRKNFDQLKHEYHQLSHVIDSLKSQIAILENEKKQMQVDHEQVIVDWKNQLESQALEFDEIKREIAPKRDLTAVKLECLAQYQEMSKGKLDFLTTEIDKWRNSYFNCQQEFDRFKTETKGRHMEYQAALEDMASNHQQQLTILQQKLSAKNDALEETSQISQRLRDITRENSDLHIKCNGLQSDLKGLEATIVDNRSHYQINTQNLQRQISERDSELRNLENQIQVMKKLQVQREHDMHVSNTHQEEQQDELVKLRAQIAQLTSSHQHVVQQFNVERHDMNFAFAKERTEFEEQLKIANSNISAKTAELESMKLELGEIQEQKIVIDRERDQAIVAAKEDFSSQERHLKEKMLEMEKDFARVSSGQASTIKDLERQIDSLKGQNNHLDSQLSAVRLQNQTIAAENAEIAGKYKTLQESYDTMDKTATNNEHTLTRQKTELHGFYQKEENLNNRVLELQDRIADMERKALTTDEEHFRAQKLMQKENEELMLQIKQLQTQKDSIEEDFLKNKSSSDSNVTKLVEAIRKIKSGYKQRIQRLQEEIEDLQEDNNTLRKSLENENHEAQLRLREMFKRQQEFANLLRSEGLVVSNTGQSK